MGGKEEKKKLIVDPVLVCSKIFIKEGEESFEPVWFCSINYFWEFIFFRNILK